MCKMSCAACLVQLERFLINYFISERHGQGRRSPPVPPVSANRFPQPQETSSPSLKIPSNSSQAEDLKHKCSSLLFSSLLFLSLLFSSLLVSSLLFSPLLFSSLLFSSLLFSSLLFSSRGESTDKVLGVAQVGQLGSSLNFELTRVCIFG